MNAIDWPQLPDFGVFLTWPEGGLEAIHPDDREVAQGLIPSDRVMRRTSFENGYYTVQYGEISFRIQPSLWLQVSDEGFQIGDRVEVPSRMMQAEPMIAVISEMRFSQARNAILYTLYHHEMPFPRSFTAAELHQLSHHEHLKPGDIAFPIPRQIDIPNEEKPIAIDDSAPPGP
jgi:hypothetical protein